MFSNPRSLFVLLVSGFGAISAWAGPVVLVDNHRPVGKIYVSEAPPQGSVSSPVPKKGRPAVISPLQNAGAELKYHLEEMTGAALEIIHVKSPSEATGPGILLGDLALKAGAKPAGTKYKDSFQILTKGRQVLIAGDSDQATLNGVYTLLGILGCDWVMPGKIGEVIPKLATVSIPELDLRQQPSFPSRDLWYRGSSKLNTPENLEEFAQWKRRQRLNSNPLVPELGAGHVWDQLIKRHKEEFEKDPTMLALVRGSNGELQRKGPQLESTHPRIVELFVEEIKSTFEKKGWPKDKVVAFGIGPADGMDYSISNESLLAGSGRIDPIVGTSDVTDLLVLLGNQIIVRIEKDYPNVSLGYYSYSSHADYPVKYKPSPKLNQIFAPINFSRFHGVVDENSKTRPHYRGIVEKWGALSKEQGNLLGYRGYNWNLAENMLPYSQLRILGEEIPWYHKNGIIAINIEATKAWAVNGPHDFLLAKLAWDSNGDWQKILRDYCYKAFGEGGASMEKYFRDLTERQHAAGQEAGSYHAYHLIYDQAFVAAGKSLVHKAIEQAETADQKARARHFLHPLEELELYLKFHTAFTRFDFTEASRLYQEMLDSWQSAYDQNSNLVAKEVPQYLKRYLEKFVNEGALYSSAPYRIVYEIPDRLPTMLDPNNVGEQLNFPNPALNDSMLFSTRTWSAPWDAQGLGSYRSGAVWYRIPVDIPADLKSQPLGLFVGGVEDEVFVWLNGTYVGRSGRGFSVPFVFDLTEMARAGEKNVLALKVVRNSAANEIGLGGIIRPCYIFTGPRIEKKTGPEEPTRRVLPGGELGAVVP